MPSRRRIIDDRLYAHFVAFSVCRRRRLLDHDHPKRIVLGVLNEELRQREALCIGCVLMPDHVHGIIRLAQTGGLECTDGNENRAFISAPGIGGAEPNYSAGFGEGDRFWQPKYYSFEIYETAKLDWDRMEDAAFHPLTRGRFPTPANRSKHTAAIAGDISAA